MEPFFKQTICNYGNDDFKIVINEVGKGGSIVEKPEERTGMFYYACSGSLLLESIEDPSEFVEVKKGQLVDVRKLSTKEIRTTALLDSEIIIITPKDASKKTKWKASLHDNESGTIQSDKKTRVIMCLQGMFYINGKPFSQFNFSVLKPNTEYRYHCPMDAINSTSACILKV